MRFGVTVDFHSRISEESEKGHTFVSEPLRVSGYIHVPEEPNDPYIT